MSAHTTAKFPKGVPMTVEEVAAVVGDEFREMNENPPPSVVKVREEMEGKTATRKRLTWQRQASDVTFEVTSTGYDLPNRPSLTVKEILMLFGTNKNLDVRLDPRDRDKVLVTGDRHIIERIMASLDQMGQGGFDSKPIKTAASTGGLYGYPKGIQRSAETASRKLARHAIRVAKRIFAKDANVVPFLQMHAKREKSSSARVLLAAMQEVGPKLASIRTASGPERRMMTVREQADAKNAIRSHKGNTILGTNYVIGKPYKLNGDTYIIYDSERVGSDIHLILVSVDGKAIVTGISAGLHNVTLWDVPRTWDEIKKDEELATLYAQYVFGLLHDELPESKRIRDHADKALKENQFNQWGVSLFSWPQARKVYEDMVDERKLDSRLIESSDHSQRSAAAMDYGLYGFRAKTADLGLDACKEVRAMAGRITADLHRRKADLHDKLTGFWSEHSKQAKCAYARMLMACYPDASMKYATRGITGSMLPGTNRFVHTSSNLRADSGVIRLASALPSEFKAFRDQVRAKAASEGVDPTHVKFALSDYRDVHVAAFLNEDGKTRDVDGVAKLTAQFHDVAVAHVDVGFTGLYESGPPMTVLASGDWIEWED